MQPQVVQATEPIPGYHVGSFLGSGGYGEVWKVQAPGGLTKAIKFVYGWHDETRAEAELKALERVKEVRHPFLLSLERIEIIEGRLMVVTELADGSLRDRVNACRREGLAGVPRDELVRYMRDAADALDFMSAEHSLQHLDIKPENLLLLSGHVKVADFGLVKDLQNMTVTLMSGLTPLYAAPEVLRGCPSDRSDQYSLAALYQEMLTGVPPFRGESAAELTEQHLAGDPDLSSLPPADIPVIARALSKDPQERFSSCQEFAAALAQPHTSTVSAGVQDYELPASEEIVSCELALDEAPPGSATIVCNEEADSLCDDAVQESSLKLPPLPEKDPEALEPVAFKAACRAPVPTVYLAIGETAGHVLRHLRRRLNDRFGDVSAVPAVQMLLIDTDSKSLIHFLGGDQRSALQRDDTLAVSLRRPQRFRENADKLLRWLNRRWLYNIPRSQKTEGLRPLGRLAFADHAPMVIQRLRETFSRALEPDSIDASSRQTGMAFQGDAIKVYLVSSISGGTGSGMSLDVAYAVHSVLDALGVSEREVVGLFAHSTGKTSRHRDVAMVNAFSWLTEFNHYYRPGGSYPGDPTCGLEALEPGSDALAHAYLVHLGEALSDQSFARATEVLAHYVYLDSMTSAGSFFSACRSIDSPVPEVVAPQAKLRSFGLHTISGYPDEVIERATTDLCRRVLLQWSAPHDPRNSQSGLDIERVTSGSEEKAKQLGLHYQAMAEQGHRTIERTLGCDGASYLSKLLEGRDSFNAMQCMQAVAAIDQVFGGSDSEGRGAPMRILGRPIPTFTQLIATQLSAELRHWIIAQIDLPHARLSGAREALRVLSERVEKMESEAKRLVQSSARKRHQAVPGLHRTEGKGHSREGARLTTAHEIRDYFLMSLDQCALQWVAALSSSIRSELKQVSDELRDVTRTLEGQAETLERSLPSGAESDPFEADDPASVARLAVEKTLRSESDRLMVTVNQRIDQQLSIKHGGLFRASTGSLGARKELFATLHNVARQSVIESVSQADLMGNLVHAGEDSAVAADSLHAYLAAAEPSLARYGAVPRLLTVLPSSFANRTDGSGWLEDAGLSGAAVVGSDNELTFCYEVDWLSVAHVAMNLIQRSPRHAECAARLHTRRDVAWSSLVGSIAHAVRSQDRDP